MISFIAFAVVAAGPVVPTEHDIACVVGRVSAEARGAVVAEASSGRGGPVREEIMRAAASCRSEQGWSEDREERSAMASAALILGDEAARELRSGGVSVAEIDRWFRRQPLEVRINPDVSEEDIDELLTALRAAGTSEERVIAHADIIGLYLGSRISLEAINAGRLE